MVWSALAYWMAIRHARC